MPLRSRSPRARAGGRVERERAGVVTTPEPASVPSPEPLPEAIVVAAVDAADQAVLEPLRSAPGVRVLEAAEGREALDLLRRGDVVLAIVDARLPGMSGIDLAMAMRAAGPRALPIILLGASEPGTQRLIGGGGSDLVDILPKPVDPLILRRRAAVFIERGRQRALLADHAEQLRALSRTFEILIGALGHDLRSPLNAISLACETLLLARPGDEMATLVGGRIRLAAQRMSRQIVQILEVAALRSGPCPVAARDADLAELGRAAAGELPELGEGGVDWAVEGDPRGSWDPERLLRLFSSLFGYALDHGAAGEPIAVRIDGRNADALIVEVV